MFLFQSQPATLYHPSIALLWSLLLRVCRNFSECTVITDLANVPADLYAVPSGHLGREEEDATVARWPKILQLTKKVPLKISSGRGILVAARPQILAESGKKGR